MIDLKKLRENRAEYEAGFKKKQVDIDVDTVLKLDEQNRQLIQEVEKMRAEKNEVSKAIAGLSGAERDKKIKEMKALGEII